MPDYTNIKQLLQWAEDYEGQLEPGKSWHNKDFANWLTQNLKNTEAPEPFIHANRDGFIAMYIAFMYKYATFYAKKMFRFSAIYSLDDFGVLATLFPDKNLRKADVIRMNIFEKPSGNEVIKRLLRQNLITESNNPSDKRSKLIALTGEGKNEFFKISTPIDMLSKTVTGDLSEAEKSELLAMLIKLHAFHKPLFEANDEAVLNTKLGL